MEQAGGREERREDRQWECGEERGEAGAEAEGCTSSAAPIISGAPPVRAPQATWAVSPPAPWHTGIPPIAPARRFADPKLVASRPGRIPSALSPKSTRAASAVARHEFANESGSCGNTRTVKAVPIVAQSRSGSARLEAERRFATSPRAIPSTPRGRGRARSGTAKRDRSDHSGGRQRGSAGAGERVLANDLGGSERVPRRSSGRADPPSAARRGSAPSGTPAPQRRGAAAVPRRRRRCPSAARRPRSRPSRGPWRSQSRRTP